MLSKHPLALIVIAGLAAAAAIIGWRVLSPPADGAIVNVKVPQLSQMAARGKQAYDATCAACHGTNGAGSSNGPPLVHDIYNPGHHPDAAFFFAAQQGVTSHHWNFGNMPPQRQVSAEEIALIVRYVRELQQANGIFYKPHRM